MMVRCIGGAKMTMTATISSRLPSNGQPVTGNGEYVRVQDPDSGEILTEWVPAPVGAINPQAATYEIPCYARGYTDLGFRSSANHEIILKGEYNVFEAVEFTYPGRFNRLTRQSYITKIADAKDPSNILWTEEETGLPTVFQIQGMTPIYDPFGKLREWTGVVIRSEIQ